MNKKNIVGRVTDCAERQAQELGYELVDVEYVREYGNNYLRIYIHKPGGVSLDDCQLMSEKVGEQLDELEIIDKAYYLEVSSPGLDRPIKTDRDYERNLGKEIEVNLYNPIDGTKKLEGILESYSDSIVIIKSTEREHSLPRESISLARLTIKF
ncbi:MAG: ribosome maturation factor RimP [Gudongella sp.]|jgi:ribosome maturation factor RimP|nr:ribosome maturation factor RimP [Gudongella sp.]